MNGPIGDHQQFENVSFFLLSGGCWYIIYCNFFPMMKMNGWEESNETSHSRTAQAHIRLVREEDGMVVAIVLNKNNTENQCSRDLVRDYNWITLLTYILLAKMTRISLMNLVWYSNRLHLKRKKKNLETKPNNLYILAGKRGTSWHKKSEMIRRENREEGEETKKIYVDNITHRIKFK